MPLIPKLAFLAAVGVVLEQGTIFSQMLPDAPLPPEDRVEHYQDPPMFIWRTGTSERRISQHGPFTSYQVNVDLNGQNITGDAANEP